MSKNWNEMIFWQKLEREGVKNKLSKIEALHFVWFITQSGPTNSQRLVENVHFYFRKRLFADTLSANKKIFADTLSVNKKLFADTLSANKKLFADTQSVNKKLFADTQSVKKKTFAYISSAN